MGMTTAIEWTDSTWNPWHGCTPCSPGCNNCYMIRDARRYGLDPLRVAPAAMGTFWAPVAKRRGEWKWRDCRRVFVCSWSDFFHPNADAWRGEAWNIIRQRPGLTFQILTKRPELAAARLPADWGDGWSNVWLGVTAENQEMADRRIPILLSLPAAKRFVSVEPMLGRIDLLNIDYGRDPNAPIPLGPIDWVICGGESGPKARPMHPDWARLLRDRCQPARIPFFFKQWGEWASVYDRDVDDPDWRDVPRLHGNNERFVNLVGGHGFHGERVIFARRVGRKVAGCLLDGREWKEFPV